jgi:hypothetical protein
MSSGTDGSIYKVVDSKNMTIEDIKVLEGLLGSLKHEFAERALEEKKRKEADFAETLKYALDELLGGNWNVIMGIDYSVKIGLNYQNRMARFVLGEYRAFCFETHTTVKTTAN